MPIQELIIWASGEGEGDTKCRDRPIFVVAELGQHLTGWKATRTAATSKGGGCLRDAEKRDHATAQPWRAWVENALSSLNNGRSVQRHHQIGSEGFTAGQGGQTTKGGGS